MDVTGKNRYAAQVFSLSPHNDAIKCSYFGTLLVYIGIGFEA